MYRFDGLEIQRRTKPAGRGICKVFGELLLYIYAPAASSFTYCRKAIATCDGVMPLGLC